MNDNKDVAVACDLFLIFRKKFIERLLPNSKMKKIVVMIFDDVLDEILLDISRKEKRNKVTNNKWYQKLWKFLISKKLYKRRTDYG